MTKYNTLKIKFSNSQLNKLTSGIKNDTEVTLNLSMRLVILMMKHIFLINYYYLIHKLQVFANGSSANIKFSKTELSKMVQSGGSNFNEMPFNLFKILNSVGNSVELYTEELKKKKIFLWTQKRQKIFL